MTHVRPSDAVGCLLAVEERAEIRRICELYTREARIARGEHVRTREETLEEFIAAAGRVAAAMRNLRLAVAARLEHDAGAPGSGAGPSELGN